MPVIVQILPLEVLYLGTRLLIGRVCLLEVLNFRRPQRQAPEPRFHFQQPLHIVLLLSTLCFEYRCAAFLPSLEEKVLLLLLLGQQFPLQTLLALEFFQEFCDFRFLFFYVSVLRGISLLDVRVNIFCLFGVAAGLGEPGWWGLLLIEILLSRVLLRLRLLRS